MITESPDTFLQDFGVTVAWGNVSALGILEMPDQVIGGGLAISTEYSVLVENAKFTGAKFGDAITIQGSAYTVREYKQVDDGLFSRITLTKT